MAETESWSRTHSNGWTGGVGQMGLMFHATAAPPAEDRWRSAPNYAAGDLAKAKSDEMVRRESDHACTDACKPWLSNVRGR